MDLREHMEYLAMVGLNTCQSSFNCDDCPFSDNGCSNRFERSAAAKKWLSDYPETPAEPPVVTHPVCKSASLGDATYFVTLDRGRISVYRWIAGDYTYVSFPGKVADLEHFYEMDPAAWFAVAAEIIAGRL